MSLYPYQEEALWWMNRLESDVSELQNPLFLYKHDRDGEKYYVHKYRGVVWSAPPPTGGNCRGGILADDMGVGKVIVFIWSYTSICIN